MYEVRFFFSKIGSNSVSVTIYIYSIVIYIDIHWYTYILVTLPGWFKILSIKQFLSFVLLLPCFWKPRSVNYIISQTKHHVWRFRAWSHVGFLWAHTPIYHPHKPIRSGIFLLPFLLEIWTWKLDPLDFLFLACWSAREADSVQGRKNLHTFAQQ